MPAIKNAERRLVARTTALLPEHRPAGSRGLILEVALRLFAERGFAGTSIRDIAAGAKVRSASLYAHYPSKAHILSEICRIGHEEHLRGVRDELLACQPDPREQIAAYVRGHVRMHATFPMLAVVANAELHMLDAKLGATTFELRNQSIELLQELVQRGVDRGLFDVADVWLATAAIGGMGLRVSFWYSPDYSLGPDEVAEHYVDFAWRILGIQTGKRVAGHPGGEP